MTFDNTNRGALFVNTNKKTEKHPDYSGTVNINGTDHFISGWKKTSKGGQTYLSISIGKPKSTAKSDVLPVENKTPFDDDLPF